MTVGSKLNYLNYKDNLRRQLFLRDEKFNKFIRLFIVDKRVKFSIRFFIRFVFVYKRRAMKSKIRNRCLLTGRSRFILRYFRLSRASFRDLASFGFLSGVKKNI